MPKPSRYSKAALKAGYRSGLEAEVGEQLDAIPGLVWEYETRKITYSVPSRMSKYTPDFPITTLGTGKLIYIETKGKFEVKDRQKHLLIKDQHPEIDIRFVFSNPNQRISKQSKTTYAMWCQKFDFLFAAKRVPLEWIKE